MSNELLINNPKSNNSEVLSNKQIEEMARELFSILSNTMNGANFDDLNDAVYRILNLANYRKQSEVIRCKDCEYFKEYTDEYKRDFKYKTEKADGDCHIRLINTYLGNSQYCACKYDDFCSFAKAKGGGEG